MKKVSKQPENDLQLVIEIENTYVKSIEDIIKKKGNGFILNFMEEHANDDLNRLKWYITEFEKVIDTAGELFTKKTESEVLSMIKLALLGKYSVESYIKIEYLKETNATIKSDTQNLQLKLDKIIDFTQFPDALESFIKLIQELPPVNLGSINYLRVDIFYFFKEQDEGKIKSSISPEIIEKINNQYMEIIDSPENLSLYLLSRRFASCLNELSDFDIGFEHIFQMSHMRGIFSIIEQPTRKSQKQIYNSYQPTMGHFSLKDNNKVKIFVPKD
jgi:hypothetical protein